MLTSFLSLRCALLTYDAGGPHVLAVAGEQGIIQDQSLAELGVVKIPVRSENEIVSQF